MDYIGKLTYSEYTNSAAQSDLSRNNLNSKGINQKRKPTFQEKYDFMESVGFPDDIIDAFKAIHGFKNGGNDKDFKKTTKEPSPSLMSIYAAESLCDKIVRDIGYNSVRKLGNVLADRYYKTLDMLTKDKGGKTRPVKIEKNSEIVKKTIEKQPALKTIKDIELDKYYKIIAMELIDEIFWSSVKDLGYKLSEKFVKALLNLDSDKETSIKNKEKEKSSEQLTFFNNALLNIQKLIRKQFEEEPKSSANKDLILLQNAIEELKLMNKENIDTVKYQTEILLKILDKFTSSTEKDNADGSLYIKEMKKEFDVILNYNKTMETQLNERLDILSDKMDKDSSINDKSQDRTMKHVKEFSFNAENKEPSLKNVSSFQINEKHSSGKIEKVESKLSNQTMSKKQSANSGSLKLKKSKSSQENIDQSETKEKSNKEKELIQISYCQEDNDKTTIKELSDAFGTKEKSNKEKELIQISVHQEENDKTTIKELSDAFPSQVEAVDIVDIVITPEKNQVDKSIDEELQNTLKFKKNAKHHIHDKWIQNYPHLIHLVLTVENTCISLRQEALKYIKKNPGSDQFYHQLLNISGKSEELSNILVKHLGMDKSPIHLIEPISSLLNTLKAQSSEEFLVEAPNIPIKKLINNSELLIRKIEELEQSDGQNGTSKDKNLFAPLAINFTKCSTSMQMEDSASLHTKVYEKTVDYSLNYIMSDTFENIIESIVKQSEMSKKSSNDSTNIKMLDSLLNLDSYIEKVMDDVKEAMEIKGEISENLLNNESIKFPQNLQNLKSHFNSFINSLNDEIESNLDFNAVQPISTDFDSMTVDSRGNPMKSLSMWGKSFDRILSDTMKDVLEIGEFASAISHTKGQLLKLKSILDDTTQKSILQLEEGLLGQETSGDSLFDESLTGRDGSSDHLLRMNQFSIEMKNCCYIVDKAIEVLDCGRNIQSTIKRDAISWTEDAQQCLNHFLRLNDRVAQSLNQFISENYRNFSELVNLLQGFEEQLKNLKKSLNFTDVSRNSFNVLHRPIKNLILNSRLIRENISLLNIYRSENEVQTTTKIQTLAKSVMNFINELSSTSPILTGLMNEFPNHRLTSELNSINEIILKLLRNSQTISSFIRNKVDNLVNDLLELHDVGKLLISKTQTLIDLPNNQKEEDDSKVKSFYKKNYPILCDANFKTNSLNKSITEFLKAAALIDVRYDPANIDRMDIRENATPSFTIKRSFSDPKPLPEVTIEEILEQFDNLVRKVQYENMSAEEFSTLLKLLNQLSNHFKKIAIVSNKETTDRISISKWEEMTQDSKNLRQSKDNKDSKEKFENIIDFDNNLKRILIQGKETQVVTINFDAIGKTTKSQDGKEENRRMPKNLGDHLIRGVDDNISMLCGLCHRVMNQKKLNFENTKQIDNPPWSYIAACQNCLDTCDKPDMCSVHNSSCATSLCTDCLNQLRIVEFQPDKLGMDNNSNATVSLEDFCSYCALHYMDQTEFNRYFMNNCNKKTSENRIRQNSNTCLVDLQSLDCKF